MMAVSRETYDIHITIYYYCPMSARIYHLISVIITESSFPMTCTIIGSTIGTFTIGFLTWKLSVMVGFTDLIIKYNGQIGYKISFCNYHDIIIISDC